MKRWLWITVLLAVASSALVQQSTTRGQVPAPKSAPNPGDYGPGAGGAVLRVPGAEPAPSVPASMQHMWGSGVLPTNAAARINQPSVVGLPSNQVDINKDITITPEVGPWTIMVMSYTTPRDAPGVDAAKMAREFVNEWNTNPVYAKFKLKAHVFNYGAEEKRKEYERVQKLKQDQLAALNQAGLNGKTMPIRYATIHVDEQTAVLLGGFKDAESATVIAKELRRLAPPDPKRVKLDIRTAVTYEDDTRVKGGAIHDTIVQYVNPFTKAFPVRNPSIKLEASGMTADAEMKLLRHFNREEKYSLLECKKPVTLAIKQYNAAQKTMTDKKEAQGFIDRFSKGMLGLQKGEFVDHAAHNAHNLAEALRKTGIEAYVLHCQYCSYVTVGNYSSVTDPQLVQMQRVLETHFQNQGFQVLDLFPRPMPMPVPGVAIPAASGLTTANSNVR